MGSSCAVRSQPYEQVKCKASVLHEGNTGIGCIGSYRSVLWYPSALTHSPTNTQLFVMLHRNRRQTAHCNTIETAAARGHTQRCNVEISYFSPAAGKLLPHWELAKWRERTNCRWKIIFARLPWVRGFFLLLAAWWLCVSVLKRKRC